jgi:hypothetical protein
MLTLEKLRVYESFDGDIDGWARTARSGNPHGMTDADWFLIDELRQALHQVAAGLASSHYKAQLDKRLLDATDDLISEKLQQPAAGARTTAGRPRGRRAGEAGESSC